MTLRSGHPDSLSSKNPVIRRAFTRSDHSSAETDTSGHANRPINQFAAAKGAHTHDQDT